MDSYSYFHQSEIHPDRIWGHTRSNILQPYALNGVKKLPQKVTVAPLAGGAPGALQAVIASQSLGHSAGH